MMKKCLVVLLTMIVVLSLVLAVGCQQAPTPGPPGAPGTPGTQGSQGTQGTSAPEAPRGQ
jgi:hypothetical protein